MRKLANIISRAVLISAGKKIRRHDIIITVSGRPPGLRAERLYDLFVELLRRGPFPVATGVFQARMDVESINDGPVTLIIDSRDRQVRGKEQSRPREPARSGLALLRRERTPLWLASRSPRRVQLLEMLEKM